MKIQTFSIICGSAACNAKCPYCVSQMTPSCGIKIKQPNVNWRNFKVASALAQKAGATTAMLTGKGEPTLWPRLIEQYLKVLHNDFPLIELQTNGINLSNGQISDEELYMFYAHGLTTVAISIVHWEDDKNKEIYLPHRDAYPSLIKLIKRLHDIGLSVRLNCTMLRDYVGSRNEVLSLIDFARTHKVEQLTLVPVNAPINTDTEQSKWINNHHVTEDDYAEIKYHLELTGSLLMELPHGAAVFDYEGQNVCLSNCLNNGKYNDKSVIRNLIFFPDGHLRYDWEHSGATLL